MYNTFMTDINAKEYYRELLSRSNIITIANELLQNKSSENSAEIRYECPKHNSQSKSSLIIFTKTQSFRCFGCGVSGDALQLVEFVKTGQITSHTRGNMPESHRIARDTLADMVGMPRLSTYGLSPEEIAAIEVEQKKNAIAMDTLAKLTAYYEQQLQQHPEVIAWIKKNYNFSDETIKEFHIGYSDNSDLKLMCDHEWCIREEEKLLSGAWVVITTHNNEIYKPLFNNRVIFPYFYRGNVVNMIGRSTPWTPTYIKNNKECQEPKYKKLQAHKDHKYIAPYLDNSHLYNEDVLSNNNPYIVIAEGITDCISLASRGIPTVSPVTVRLKHDDSELIAKHIKHATQEVILCLDNEISEIGYVGARATANYLIEQGISCRIAELPLGGEQRDARNILTQKYALGSDANFKEFGLRTKKLSEDAQREIDALTLRAKIDIAEFFVQGHTADDFQRVIDTAKHPISLDIAELSNDITAEGTEKKIRAIFRKIARMPVLQQDTFTQELKNKFGKSLSAATIKKILASAKAEYANQQEEEQGDGVANHTVEYVPGESGVNTVVTAVKIDDVYKNMIEITSGWPKRVNNMLFVDNNGDICYITSPDSLFAWIQSKSRLQWKRGNATDGETLVTKAEYYEYLCANAEFYEAVELYPHEPPLEKHYYAWKAPEDYSPTGEYLDKLLSMFTNYETEEDKALIKAMFLTPAWGGELSSRPAFTITAPDRGCGKSTISDAVGLVYGNIIDLVMGRKAEDDFVPRLLTPSALTKRIVRIDNVKQELSSEMLEGIITATTISGKQMYYGENSRPNTLVFFITGNGIRLSRDMAERCFILRLRRPDLRPEWKSEVTQFVSQYQKYILADIIYELKKNPTPTTAKDRWMSFVSQVLPHCTNDVTAVVKLNHLRRSSCDDDLEEAEVFMQAIETLPGRQLMNSNWLFVTRKDISYVINDECNTKMTTRRILNILRTQIEAGHLPRLQEYKTDGIRGFKYLPEGQIDDN